MIMFQFCLDVVDNSGVCEIMCICVFNSGIGGKGLIIGGGGNKCYVYVGDIIVVLVKDVVFRGVVKVGDVVKVVVVCISYVIKCVDGSIICFDCNVVVIINNQGEFRGICVFGLVVCELCDCCFMKIVFLVLEVL